MENYECLGEDYVNYHLPPVCLLVSGEPSLQVRNLAGVLGDHPPLPRCNTQQLGPVASLRSPPLLSAAVTSPADSVPQIVSLLRTLYLYPKLNYHLTKTSSKNSSSSEPFVSSLGLQDTFCSRPLLHVPLMISSDIIYMTVPASLPPHMRKHQHLKNSLPEVCE